MYNLNIKEIDLKSMLNEYYGVNIELKNDAKCAALAEKRFGALKNYKDAVFLCLGTGIGGATFYNGKLLEHKRSAGSEYGHMIITKDGIECNCGNKGCFEKYASMQSFKIGLKQLLNLDEEILSNELLDILLKEHDNEKVNNYIDEFIDNLILGISNITNSIEPEVICLGASFVYLEKILYTRLIEKLDENKYKFNKPEIILAKLGNDAGIIGASLI